MEVELTVIQADAGVKLHTEFVYADVDGDDETAIDITGYSAVISFRRTDADEDVLTLTSNPAAGITITGASGLIAMNLTAEQTEALSEDGGEHAWKLDLTATGETDPEVRFAGQITTRPWP